MKVVIAPDSFKESLPASEVAAAMGQGVLDVCSNAVVDLCPLADGGEGTVTALTAATGGQLLTADVFDPLGRPIRARLGLLGGSSGPGLPGELGFSAAVAQPEDESPPTRRAVVEMSSASGLMLVPPEHRDPLRTTSYGTGQLITEALNAGAEEIVVGIGGSATCDGGSGAAQALGVRFLDADGQEMVCGLSGGGLGELSDIDICQRDERLQRVSIRVACDVTNPLTGPEGAARVYAPQKGATPEGVETLERNLSHLAEVIRRSLGVDVARLAGAGAAGGLGAGLVAFADATLEAGVDLISEVVHLRRRLTGADLLLTGEGRLDSSSGFGKAAVGAARIAGDCGVPAVCIPGQFDGDTGIERLFRSVRPLVRTESAVEQAMRDPAPLLRQAAADTIRDFLRAT
ncbi:MAG: glycerate kinase [Phycisphaerae bacterium]